MTELKYDMDPRWEGYIIPYDRDRFELIANKLICPSENVPVIIKKKLSQVRSLYKIVAIDYELQDIVEFLMYTVLELALRTKFELENQKSTTKGLTGLLYWAKKRKFLDLKANKIEFIVEMRNKFAHLSSPEDLHGITSSYLIKEINDLINELYSK
jgi:hypothetical protein